VTRTQPSAKSISAGALPGPAATVDDRPFGSFQTQPKAPRRNYAMLGKSAGGIAMIVVLILFKAGPRLAKEFFGEEKRQAAPVERHEPDQDFDHLFHDLEQQLAKERAGGEAHEAASAVEGAEIPIAK
jgi:hypothetical protein